MITEILGGAFLVLFIPAAFGAAYLALRHAADTGALTEDDLIETEGIG